MLYEVITQLQGAGNWTFDNESIVLEGGDFVRDLEQLASLPVNVIDGTTVYLRDVARIVDGPAEPETYGWIDFAPGHPAYSGQHTDYPMVAISVAKSYNFV